nr:zinc finger, CCHC-type [Tanacetum cinerariifolium]
MGLPLSLLVYTLVRPLHSRSFFRKQEEGQSVSSYVLKIKGYIDNLECLGNHVKLDLAVSLILIGPRKEFNGFVYNYNMHSLGKTINELHAMLKLYEKTQPKNNVPALHAIQAGKVQKVNKHKKLQPQMASRGQNQEKGKNKLAYAPKPKIPPSSKREDPIKDLICHECSETEHWKKNCPQGSWYKAALLDPESDKWLNAMNEEMQSMKDNEGYTQTLGIDYEETFSPIADISAIRILIAIVAFYDYKIWKIDVKTAFLNGCLFEEVYKEQPEGFVNPKYSNRRSNVTRCKILSWKVFCYERFRYHMENSKRRSIHMQDKLRLSKSEGASTPTELKRMQNVLYALAVGFIMFVVRCTRHDVAGDIKRELRVSCYTDAGYLMDVDYLKSQTRYVFVLNGGIVDWKSAKQSIFATSSTEAEYITAFDASKEVVWVRKLISGLGVVPTIKEPISMYCDNIGAITIANESGITKGARHFRAKVHYLREVIEYGDVKLEKVHTNDNLADPFTKALAFLKHSGYTKNIGMLSASSLM